MVLSAVHFDRSSAVNCANSNAESPMLTRFCGLAGSRRLVIVAV